MRALCAALGEPQSSWRSVHVVGTNGKSSVTVMTAALLEEMGAHTGACISPHTSRWRERTWIGGHEIDADSFAAAAGEVAAAIATVEPGFADGARITQFEAAIATSFVAFRNAGVEVAVVEAGLGGRLDATNVIPSLATALTSVGLDHTEWLGDSVEQIAAEKLAVLQPQTALVIGSLAPGIAALARSHAAELGCCVIEAREPAAQLLPERFGPYLWRNAGVAIELASLAGAAEVSALGPERIRAALERARLGGRFERVEGEPPMVLDAAHNRDGAEALAEALTPFAGSTSLVLCVSVLADKDAAGIAAELAPLARRVICTAADPGPAMGRPGAVALDPELLATHFRSEGADAIAIADPAAACAATLALAKEAAGLAVFAGSHYLLRYAWTAKPDPNFSR